MGRAKDILFSMARDSTGQFIHAAEANRSEEFTCDLCNGEMILRRSLKEGKGSKRPHFAHKSLTPNCTPESALHFTFKNLLFSFLKERIEGGIPYKFCWKCESCDEVHSGDLLKKAKRISLEHNLNTCQPDIALLNEAGEVYAVIEVVVSHKPEESTLQYYSDNGIVLLQINLKSDRDLMEYPKRLYQPDRVTLCVNPKCVNCGAYQRKRKLWVIDGPCWKCSQPMKVASVETAMESILIEKFNEEELRLAKENGAIIQKRYSKTAEGSYLVNVCKSCNSFAGNWYLGVQYLLPAKNGELSSVNFDTGFDCIKCELKKYNEGYFESDDERPLPRD